MATLQYNAKRRYNDALTYNGESASTTAPASGRHYEIRAVQMNGTPIASWGHGVNNCNLHRYTDQLNHPGSMEFSLNLYDDKATKIKRYTEVQVWKNDVLDWWGVVVGIRTSEGGRVTFNCQGLQWYLMRRFIGRADRTNKATNPDFESGTTGWTGAGGTTFTVDNADRKTGSQSAKLVHTTADSDAYIRQSISVTSGGVGELVTVAAWFKLTAGFEPALFDRGLFIQRSSGSVVKESKPFEINEETASGSWVRAEATVHMPPNVTETIEWRLYSPKGTIRWDSVSVTLMESISYYNTDQATIFSTVVEHLQDTAYNKSDVKILRNFPFTGVKIDWHSQFAEHQDFGSIVTEFTERSNGFDISIGYGSDGKTRTMASHYPRKGIQKNEFAITGDHLVEYSYVDDGERGVSSMTILSSEDGPDREEGGAIDSAVFSGLILEAVESAPTGADIASLDTIAEERLRVLKNPTNLHVTVQMDVRDLSTIRTGDTIPVNIDDGWTQVTGNWRVISRTIAPHHDNVTLELNPA